MMIETNFLIMVLGAVAGALVIILVLRNSRESTDHLTGLLDNQYFLKWSRRQMDRGKAFHVVAVDIHQLKRINTLFGSETGNQILVETAKKLKELCGSNSAFRISGRRLLAVTQSLAEYERLRNELEKFFDTDFVVDEKPIRVLTVICGVMDAEKLKNGSSLLGYIDYLVSITSKVGETIMIQGDEKTLQGFRYEKEIQFFLHQAIEEDMFDVFYQPIYSRKTGEYVALEALSRLHHPKLGQVSPELFIGIAEKNGQIEKIGNLQLHRICRFIKEHEHIMDKIHNVKVNISPAELLRSGSGQQIMNVIRQYGLPFKYFQFEITETEATEYCDNLYRTLTDFVEAGIELCMDDFGSGYANLSTVLRLPFTTIKLDRSLLTGIYEVPKMAAFYKNIVSTIQNMGYLVVSEGVETSQELELVSRWGVDLIQGYYFSKPLPAAGVLELLKN